jgi:hypothetical protein
MTLFYSSQPKSLPPSLPPGTRYKFGDKPDMAGCFPDGANLQLGAVYTGRVIRDDNTRGPCVVIDSKHIDWRKVPVVGGEESLEPQVGETWEAFECDGSRCEVVLVSFENARSDGHGYWACKHTERHWGYSNPGPRVENLRQLIRRLSAPTPSVPEPNPYNGRLICDDCGKELMALDACARTTTDPRTGRIVRLPGAFHAKCPEPVATPTPKEDPYRAASRDDVDMAAAMVKHDAITAKRRRFTADTLADFDRPLRLRTGGRFSRTVAAGHPSTWKSNEGADEP